MKRDFFKAHPSQTQVKLIPYKRCSRNMQKSSVSLLLLHEFYQNSLTIKFTNIKLLIVFLEVCSKFRKIHSELLQISQLLVRLTEATII